MTSDGEKPRLLFNAFHMNCVSHLQHGLWRRPGTRQTEYTSLDPWVELARLLERGCFDALFLADVVGVYDNYRGGADTAVAEAMQIPVNDPSLLIPAMALVTEHLGFAFTGSILAEHPFSFARRASTLDHLTGGRVAWNIVTSYLPSAARNLGWDDLPLHDDRYDRGDDYLDVLYKLWEASWAADAVERGVGSGRYADPAKVRTIDHVGPYYEVPGPHLCEPSPQRTPLLFQAGSSDRGRRFAARHAECIFVAGSRRTVARVATDVRARAVAEGRRSGDVKVFQPVTPVIGGTEAEAKAKAEELAAEISVEAGLAHLSGSVGADLGSIDPDRPIAGYDFNGVEGIIVAMAESAPDKSWTFGELARRQMTGQFLVGSDEQVADRLEAIADVGVDGFNIVYTSTPGTFVDFIDGVAPILQRRGRMQRSYGDGTLRRKIMGTDGLADTHPGRAVAASVGRL